MMFRCLLLIGIFGAFGAILRFWISHLPTIQNLPMGTFVVNILGSFLLGWMTGWTVHSESMSEEWRLAITTGFLGSFTTFSTFSVENARLIQQGHVKMAILNIAVQILLGLSLALYGINLGQRYHTSS